MSWMSEVDIMMQEVRAVLGPAWEVWEDGYGYRLGDCSVLVLKGLDALQYNLFSPVMGKLTLMQTEDLDQVVRWAIVNGLPTRSY